MSRFPQGYVSTKEYVIPIHQFYIAVLKMYASSYKYNMDILSNIINFKGKMLKIYVSNNKCQLLLILRVKC